MVREIANEYDKQIQLFLLFTKFWEKTRVITDNIVTGNIVFLEFHAIYGIIC